MPKNNLLIQLEKLLQTELDALLKAAATAKDGATNEESKPENKYDTRALESSYLAGAQKFRADEVAGKLHMLSNAKLKDFGGQDPIASTALVEIAIGKTKSLLFVFNIAAGFKLQLDGRPVTGVSLQSSIGEALLDRSVGDFVTVGEGKDSIEYEIISIQ